MKEIDSHDRWTSEAETRGRFSSRGHLIGWCVLCFFLFLSNQKIEVKPNTNESQNNKQTHQIHTGINKSLDQLISIDYLQSFLSFQGEKNKRESEIKSSHSVEFHRQVDGTHCKQNANGQNQKIIIITRSEHAIKKKTPTSTFFHFTLLFIRWQHFALAYRERKQSIPLVIVPFDISFQAT